MSEEPPESSSESLDDESADKPPAEDLVNAVFKKVQRTKTKFRCQLEDVMIHIAGKDLVAKSLAADISY